MKKLIVTIFLIVINFSFSQTEELKNLSLDLDLQNQDTTKVNTSLRIIKLLYESQDYTNSLKFANKSLILSKSLNYKEGLAKIYHLKGLILNKKRNVQKAIIALRAAEILYIDLDNAIETAKVSRDIGIIEIEQSNATIGLNAIFTSIEVFRENNNTNAIITTYEHLINTYSNLKQYNKAISFGLKRITIQEQFSSIDEIIKSNKELALLHRKNTNYSQAISFLQKALNYNKTNKNLRQDILPLLGGLYIKNKSYVIATNYLKESLKLNKASKNIKGIITSLSHLGYINFKNNQFETANNQFKEIDKLARSINDTNLLLKNYTFGIALDSTRGLFKSAFTKQKQYYKLLNSTLQNEIHTKQEMASADSISPLIAATAALNDEALIAKVNQGATLVSINKFDRFKNNLYISLTGLCLLAIILIIAYFKHNKGLKYTRDLELKNLDIELQKEAILEENKHIGDLNKAKDKLFSIISHDLKDSLTSTKGLIDLLKEGAITKDEFDALIPELSENANNASLLLFNLLNWSKSQMQSLESNPSAFNIKAVFKDKIKLIEQKLIAKNIDLVNNSRSELIYADRSMTEIIVQNILANAVKFCKPQDKITISNTVKNGRAIISIADTGVGISKKNINRLFKDHTFTTAGTHNEKGTGLGLSICKDLIELNGGRIWVDSFLGIGSKFYIELPLFKNGIDAINSPNTSTETFKSSYINPKNSL